MVAGVCNAPNLRRHYITRFLLRAYQTPSPLGNIMRFLVSIPIGVLRKHTDLRNVFHQLLAGLGRLPGDQLLEIAQPLCDEAPNLRQVGVHRIGSARQELVGELA